MTLNLPFYIPIVFGLTTILTLLLFVWAIKNANLEQTRKKALILAISLTAWLGVQLVLSLKNVYSSDMLSLPPKLIQFGVLPVVLLFIILFNTQSGKRFIDSLPLKNLTFLSIVRIPVEIVLLWLFLNKTIPALMTFEGRNFDILAGISAPIIAYFGFVKNKISRTGLLIWNFICLGLLLNVVTIGLLSAQTPLQKFAFEQPNIAILYFPFSWLPTFVVPAVLFCHLVSIRQLFNQKTI